ncbi:Aste57867_13485 [Aphanomyces stellatus]|uniref:Aste57867_13485 protein n=1 Tax=Aphanomyces stellatus TaxID=120398 RepID=A0A485KYK5_9STRA|nr:hypothetical protein As57867_013435 [Aphanomyces stellatus]VFT90323.1 Aste57867_13485 [Aphanomyces stellatus]
MVIRARPVLSSATTYWSETAYTVEQFVAHAGEEDDRAGTLCEDPDLLLYSVFDLEDDDEYDCMPDEAQPDLHPVAPVDVMSTLPSTSELELEWDCLNWHRVEYHWFQMQKHDPRRTRMDVSFMKVLWEGMKFPERRLYNSEQVQRLSRSTLAIAHFRETMPPPTLAPKPRLCLTAPSDTQTTTVARRDQKKTQNEYAVENGKESHRQCSPLVVY